MTLVRCAPSSGAANNQINNQTDSQKETDRETLVLDLEPYLTDHRPGTKVMDIATNYFMNDFLPYMDTYVAVNQNEGGVKVDPKWIVSNGNLKHIVVNIDNWNFMPKAVQDEAIFQFYMKLYGYTAYKVKPLYWINSLQEISGLPQERSYMNKTKSRWFKKWQDLAGQSLNANCFSLALQAGGLDVGFPNKIEIKDFDNNLADKFEKTSTPKTGDVFVLKNEYADSIHAAVFVGYSETKKKKIIL